MICKQEKKILERMAKCRQLLSQGNAGAAYGLCGAHYLEDIAYYRARVMGLKKALLEAQAAAVGGEK